MKESNIYFKRSKFREPSPLDNFYFEKSTAPTDTTPSVAIVSDVRLLLNQHRLDRMTQAALVEWLEKSSRSDSGLSSLRSKLGDKELCKFIKSRYIQSRSELLSYSAYLESVYDSVDSGVKKVLSEIENVKSSLNEKDNQDNNGGAGEDSSSVS